MVYPSCRRLLAPRRPCWRFLPAVCTGGASGQRIFVHPRFVHLLTPEGFDRPRERLLPRAQSPPVVIDGVDGRCPVARGVHLGVWSLNACRIAYVLEEEGPSRRRYGFALGTLPGHVERGEERFTLEWHRADDSVRYEVFAFARPAHPLAKAGRPFVRLVQRRFAIGSLRGMAAAVEGGSER